MKYIYTHKETKATTGYFSCLPAPEPSLDEAIGALRKAPLDEFLHRHTLHSLLDKPLMGLIAMLPQTPGEDPTLAALLMECAILNPALSELAKHFTNTNAVFLAAHTPLPYIHASLQADWPEHRLAAAAFAANIHEHHSLPHPDDEELPPLYNVEAENEQKATTGSLRSNKKFEAAQAFDVVMAAEQKLEASIIPTAESVAATALKRLEAAGIIAGPEMRHEASLSPIALLRPWQLELSVKNGRMNYSLSGKANVYGRGLSLAVARASYSMEMVERASAYASVDGLTLPMLAENNTLILATHSDLERDGIATLNPNALPLDIPYNEQAIHWIWAEEAGTKRKVLVPAQFAFLFWNIDEQSLLTANGSTGLASGVSMAGAKVSALCEIIERDAEATMPYRRSRCFTLAAKDEKIKALLDDYAGRGIQVRFQNLTNFGIPSYQSFVTGSNGQIFKASGAGLRGASAIISALTETPYPYPGGGPSAPGLTGLPVINLEDLPNLSTGSPANDLQVLEETLINNGIRPLYVNLTRKDLDLPVVRAIAPGLETGAEFDSFSRIRPRLYQNYMSGM